MKEDRVSRYLRLVHWARDRYTGPGGSLDLAIGRRLSRYCRIERAAAAKYLDGVA